jgi:hypothetical protein
MTSERTAQLAVFYAENQARLRRLVARCSRADRNMVEDACQIAWAILVRRADIPLDGRGFAWLRTVALTTGLRGTATRDIPAGVPLTTIAKQCGTSVPMIEKHYASVIENWDGVQVPAEDQIRAARRSGGREMDAKWK